MVALAPTIVDGWTQLIWFLIISSTPPPTFPQTKMALLPRVCNIITLMLSFTPTLEIPLIAPISKDDTTQLYTLSVFLKTPLQPTKLHLHLGSSLNWVLCDSTYTSSTYHHFPCNSSLCNSFPSNACSNDTCSLFPENPITRTTLLDTATIDSLALPTHDSSSSLVLISDFIFSCATPHLLQGLPTNVLGLAALGRSNYSLPAQISAALTSPSSFTLCLPSSSSNTGAAIFASAKASSKIDLAYTQLIVNPVADTVVTDNPHPSDDYFINLTSILINGKPLPINSSILTIDDNGFGGTKISTAEPYTVLESSIYKVLVQHFVNESSAFNLTVVTEAVEPFGVCYPAGDLTETRVGPAVPTVDLVMHRSEVFWRMFGGNSMVRIIRKGGVDLWCLGFVDGGSRGRTPIVIGGHQLEDNMVEFDIESNTFGFSSTLLLQATNCSNLNSQPH